MSYDRDSTFYDRDSRRSKYTDKDSDSGSYTYYSDSFYSDDEKRTPKFKKSPTKKTIKQPLRRQVNPPLIRRNNKLHNSSMISTPRTQDALKVDVPARVASARRVKLSDLQNQLGDMKLQNDELLTENKTLKRQQRLQDKALTNHEQMRDELPALLRRHAEENRINKQRIRNQSEKSRGIDIRLKDVQEELERAKSTNQRLQKLVDSGELAARDHLTRELYASQAEAQSKQSKLKELERHVENLNKNHRHEVGIERARHNETKALLARTQKLLEKTGDQLKDKEKELDIKNIYSNRSKANRLLNTSVSSVPVKAPIREIESQRNRRQEIENLTRELNLDLVESFDTPFLTEMNETADEFDDFNESDLRLRDKMREEEQEREAEIERLREMRLREDRLRKEEHERRAEAEAEAERKANAAQRQLEEEEKRARDLQIAKENEQQRAKKDELLAKMRQIDNREDTDISLMAAGGDGYHNKIKPVNQFSDTLPNSFLGSSESTSGFMVGGDVTPTAATTSSPGQPGEGLFGRNPAAATRKPKRPSFFSNHDDDDDDVDTDDSRLDLGAGVFGGGGGGRRGHTPLANTPPTSSANAGASRRRLSNGPRRRDSKPTVDNLHNGVPAHGSPISQKESRHRRNRHRDSDTDFLADIEYNPTMTHGGGSGGATTTETTKRLSTTKTTTGDFMTNLFPDIKSATPSSLADFDIHNHDNLTPTPPSSKAAGGGGGRALPRRSRHSLHSNLVVADVAKPSVNAVVEFETDDLEELHL